LERDIQILDHGDETEVGEKGISLSGGQKQRISLARALYSSSAHLLLDDCLSAVDAHTSKWIYDYCITGPLMQGRTCILVTHNVALCVPGAKYVVVLDNGRVLMQGDPETVVQSGALGSDELLKTGIRSRAHSRMPSRVPSFVGEEAPDQQANGSATDAFDAAKKQLKQKASKEEKKVEGGVEWRVYFLYLASMGPWWYWVIVTTVFVLQQIGSVATSVWIRQWAANYSTSSRAVYSTSASRSTAGYSGSCFASGSCHWALLSFIHTERVNTQSSDVDVWYYLGVYALIGIVYALLSFLREIIVFAGSLRASRDIHKALLHNIMRATGRFFDSTPLGRMMNRFSKDIEAIDQEVAPVALVSLHILIICPHVNLDRA
jgi:ABC-type multidrug transport system fused ATPase/permease subunit